MSNIINRLEALLPKLEYGRYSHTEWRDCDQKWHDRNPHVGDRDFHDSMVKIYDERIETIKEAIAQLRKNSTFRETVENTIHDAIKYPQLRLPDFQRERLDRALND